MRRDDPLAISLAGLIHAGDLVGLERLLSSDGSLANAQVEGRQGGFRTPLHMVADWPGYFPNGPSTVRLLLACGADANAGRGVEETPLHWAASSDDVEVAMELIDGGADLEAVPGSIGTPLENAVGYGSWRVGRLLLSRGARVDLLWVAAGLGLDLRPFFDSGSPSVEDVNNAFWQACHGGHRRTADYLLARGADLHWVPSYSRQTPLEVASSRDTGRSALVTWLRERAAS
jgi:ankyrin repeat protein